MENQYTPQTNQVTFAVEPRRLVPKKVFWPILTLFLLGLGALIFAYLDRKVWHNHWSDVLPARTDLLIVMPASSNNDRVQKLTKILSEIPAASDMVKVDSQAFLEHIVPQASFFEIGKLLVENQNSQFIIVKIDGKNLVILTDYAGVKSAGEFTVNKETILDQDIYILSSPTTEKIFAWPSGRNFFASTDKQLIGELINIKLSQQKSDWQNWRTNQKPAPLASEDKFKKTLLKLSDTNLIQFYLNTGKVSAVSDFASAIRLVAPNSNSAQEFIPGFRLSPESQKDVEDVEALALGIGAGDSGLELRAARLYKLRENSKNSQSQVSLAQELPRRVRGIDIDSFLEINNLGQSASKALERLRLESEEDYSRLLNTLAQNFNIQFPVEQISFLSGRVAIAAGLDDSGAPSIIFVADNTDTDRARGLGEAIVANLKPLAVEPGYEVNEKYLIAGTSRAAVLDLIRSMGTNGESLSTILPVSADGDYEAFFFLSTRILSKLGRAITASGEESSLWKAMDILTEAVPTVTVSARRDDSSLITDLYIEVKTISPHKKNEAEKILERLGTNQNLGDSYQAVADSTRRADLMTIQNAISEFSQKTGRAPISLTELVPAYLGSLPFDPASGQPYVYANDGGNSSYYFTLELKTESSFGPPGIYCLTTTGVVSVSLVSACQEK